MSSVKPLPLVVRADQLPVASQSRRPRVPAPGLLRDVWLILALAMLVTVADRLFS